MKRKLVYLCTTIIFNIILECVLWLYTKETKIQKKTKKTKVNCIAYTDTKAKCYTYTRIGLEWADLRDGNGQYLWNWYEPRDHWQMAKVLATAFCRYPVVNCFWFRFEFVSNWNWLRVNWNCKIPGDILVFAVRAMSRTESHAREREATQSNKNTYTYTETQHNHYKVKPNANTTNTTIKLHTISNGKSGINSSLQK